MKTIKGQELNVDEMLRNSDERTQLARPLLFMGTPKKITMNCKLASLLQKKDPLDTYSMSNSEREENNTLNGEK